MRRARTLAGVGVVGMALMVAGLPASASTLSPDESSDTVTIGGRTFDSADVTTTVETYEISGDGSLVGFNPPATVGGGVVTPDWVSGSSYAYSQEIHWTNYKGYGRAGGNVVNGQRIIRVCFWWTRSGATPSATTCADASFSGGYYSPGPEKIAYYADSLNPNAPKTYFNIATTRINPNF